MAVSNISPTTAILYWQMNDVNDTFEDVAEYIITLDESLAGGPPVEFGSWSTEGTIKVFFLCILL